MKKGSLLNIIERIQQPVEVVVHEFKTVLPIALGNR